MILDSKVKSTYTFKGIVLLLHKKKEKKIAKYPKLCVNPFYDLFQVHVSWNLDLAMSVIFKFLFSIEQSEENVLDNDLFIYINPIKNWQEDFKIQFKDLQNMQISQWIISPWMLKWKVQI